MRSEKGTYQFKPETKFIGEFKGRVMKDIRLENGISVRKVDLRSAIEEEKESSSLCIEKTAK